VCALVRSLGEPEVLVVSLLPAALAGYTVYSLWTDSPAKWHARSQRPHASGSGT
jgi:hypothetical protein